MMNKQKNGSKKIEVKAEASGPKKSNGHRMDCECPICKNMMKHIKKGGDEPDIENQEGDIEEAGIRATPSNDEFDASVETKASDSEYDALDEAEKGQAGVNVVGGKKSRRRTRRRSRKTSRKSRKHRRR
jgi:hypothetical protein